MEGPDTGVGRQLLPFKRLALTDFKLPIQRNARIGTIRAAAKVSMFDWFYLIRFGLIILFYFILFNWFDVVCLSCTYFDFIWLKSIFM